MRRKYNKVLSLFIVIWILAIIIYVFTNVYSTLCMDGKSCVNEFVVAYKDSHVENRGFGICFLNKEIRAKWDTTISDTKRFHELDLEMEKEMTLCKGCYRKDKNHIYRLNHQMSLEKKPGQISICCWVMTSPQNLHTKARYIQQTWTKRCDIVVFISSETNTTFPTVGVNASEGRLHLTEKTLRGFYSVAKKHMDECDWFFKADDDTYVIMENLRHFLKDKNPDEPIYYGHQFKRLVQQGYASGGSGLAVSREAMRRFAEKGLDPNTCRQEGISGDSAFGECMQSLGVTMGNSTDSRGRSRFHCLEPAVHTSGDLPDWYLIFDANGAKRGMESMSDFPISFHYVGGTQQLLLEYYFYQVKVHL